MPHYLRNDSQAIAKVRHALYRMTQREQWARLSTDTVQAVLETMELPSPLAQLDNMILWLGRQQAAPADSVSVNEGAGLAIAGAIGAIDADGVGFVVSSAAKRKLVEGQVVPMPGGVYYVPEGIKLSLDGWERFYELQRVSVDSRVAFMAMQFGDELLDRVYRDFFKDAVRATGFELKRLDEGQPAGLIDDRPRVEIRQSRFLIADLTTHNRGAYWEAGYAEGLGKPVVYTCRKDVFADKDSTKAPHFDTNHHLTVVWEPDKLPDAVTRLKATIRATLPGDAKMDD
jgi:hypothetical protein